MKKILIIAILFIYNSEVFAQEWQSAIEKNNLTIDQIAKQYGNNTTGQSDTVEGKKYHFDRWFWYWSRHTDEHGYLVSPMQKLNEWRQWTNSKKLAGASLKTTTNQSKWTFTGPDNSPGGYNGIGRINVVAFHPTDSNTYWIGSAGGGAWKTNNDGATWTVVNDYFPVLGVSDIDFNPKNPNTIYLCTGDRDANDTYSVGVLKSYDGGNTWDTTGINWDFKSFKLANSLVINPLDTNSITLATNVGIYKSYDGGDTWTITQGSDFKQLEYHPTDTNIIYAAGLDPIGTRQVFRTTNGGATWTKQSNFPGNRRVAIAVTKADVSLVRAIVVNSSAGLEGIYESTDTGKTFAKIYSATGSNCDGNILANSPKADKCGGQGWYDLTIAISPTNPLETIVGGVNTWISDDGGKNWTIASQWTDNLPGITVVHADKHYHIYQPLRPHLLFECNDGGIYKTTTPKSIWTNISDGLGITQFYRNAVSNLSPNVIGGAQDNGSIHILSNNTYDNLTGGDGMDCQLDPSDNDIFYTSSQYGSLRRTTDGGNTFKNIRDNIPGKPTGAWITPFVLYPSNPKAILAGYKEVYLSTDTGNTWTTISNTPYFNNIERLALALKSPDYVYVLVQNKIDYTDNFGTSWSTLPNLPSGNISDIHVDPWDPTHIWATCSGYTAGSKVYHYKFSTGWVAEIDSLPNIPVNCIDIDSSDGTVYIGTDFGVFYKDTSMSYWGEFNNDLPNVEVIDLGIKHDTKELWAATYGRGMWKSPKHKHASTNSITTIPLANNVIIISPNPNRGNFNIQTNNTELKNKKVSARIISMTGAVAWEQEVAINDAGQTTINVEIPKGNYVVELRYRNVLVTRSKMIKY